MDGLKDKPKEFADVEREVFDKWSNAYRKYVGFKEEINTIVKDAEKNIEAYSEAIRALYKAEPEDNDMVIAMYEKKCNVVSEFSDKVKVIMEKFLADGDKA